MSNKLNETEINETNNLLDKSKREATTSDIEKDDKTHDDETRNDSESDMSKHELIFKNNEAVLRKNILQLENVEDFQKAAVNETTTQNLLTNAQNDLTNLSNMFNSYSSKKTFATGLLDLALIATNFSQMKQLIVAKRSAPWEVIEIVIMFSICTSLVLQFICGIVIIISSKQHEFLDESKRNDMVRNNNSITILVLVITVVNIFVNVFINI